MKRFKSVVDNFLGNQRAENYNVVINKLMTTYLKLGDNTSFKVLFHYLHLVIFPSNCGLLWVRIWKNTSTLYAMIVGTVRRNQNSSNYSPTKTLCSSVTYMYFTWQSRISIALFRVLQVDGIVRNEDSTTIPFRDSISCHCFVLPEPLTTSTVCL